MKIAFWSLGKAHDTDLKNAINAFTKRVSHYFPVEWKIIAPPKATTEQELKAREASIVMQLLAKDDYLVALDERGKQSSSPMLAGLLQARANEGRKLLVFLVGGAYGLDDTVLKRADHVWSLSKLTLPHQLVRLILAEQVYRACTINRNEKYHHG